MEKLFKYYLETNDFHLKYAKGEPMTKEQEFHDYNEFVFFIKGSSFLVSRNIQQELTPGSIVLIPKEHFHQFCIKQPETYVRCILGFHETPELNSLTREVMNTIKVIAAPDEKATSVFNHVIEIATSDLPDCEKILFIKASLVQLLIYLKHSTSKFLSKSVRLSPLVSQALNIIDEQYAENLSVKSISKMLSVSTSTLAHKFSKELNLPVYRYITKKRLLAAHELIKQGESFTSAALNSGFSDYSCFYRLYKKYYKK